MCLGPVCVKRECMAEGNCMRMRDNEQSIEFSGHFAAEDNQSCKGF